MNKQLNYHSPKKSMSLLSFIAQLTTIVLFAIASYQLIKDFCEAASQHEVKQHTISK